VSFCFNEWPPYASTVDGEAVGLSVDILRESARRAGFEPRFVALPWKRCLQMVENGEIDAVMDAAERPQFIHGEVSFSVYTNVFWVRAADGPSSFEQAAREGGRLGIVAGYVYGDALEEMFERSGMAIDKSVDDGTNIKKLGFGRTDIIVADYASTRLFATENNLDLRALLPAHSLDRLYASFHVGRREKMEKIDRALRAMCAEGWIRNAYIAALGHGLDVISGERRCAPARVTGDSR
jgi:ABC-type amino acid transport substrate-binding protein